MVMLVQEPLFRSFGRAIFMLVVLRVTQSIYVSGALHAYFDSCDEVTSFSLYANSVFHQLITFNVN